MSEDTIMGRSFTYNGNEYYVMIIDYNTNECVCASYENPKQIIRINYEEVFYIISKSYLYKEKKDYINKEKEDPLLNKYFIFQGLEYRVNEALNYNSGYLCTNINNNLTHNFSCDTVSKLVKSYDIDLIELKKDRNAYIFREEDEKNLLKFIMNYFYDKYDFANMSFDDLILFKRFIKDFKLE